jgi:hypothetical protein
MELLIPLIVYLVIAALAILIAPSLVSAGLSTTVIFFLIAALVYYFNRSASHPHILGILVIIPCLIMSAVSSLSIIIYMVILGVQTYVR